MKGRTAMVLTRVVRSRIPIRCFGPGDPDPKPDEKPEPDPKPDEGAKPEEEDDEHELGDKGKKALADERTARRAAERSAKAATAELEKIRKDSMSEQEKAVAEAKAAGKAEALEVANARLVRAEVLQAATGKLADPTDAAAILELAEFEVDDDGNVDTKAIAKAVDDLLKSKPHLAATAKPGSLGGARGREGDSGASVNDWIRQQAGRG